MTYPLKIIQSVSYQLPFQVTGKSFRAILMIQVRIAISVCIPSVSLMMMVSLYAFRNRTLYQYLLRYSILLPTHCLLFLSHRIFIVGFVRTGYTVVESLHTAYICVELFEPITDIGTATVDIRISSSIPDNLPDNATLASKCYILPMT